MLAFERRPIEIGLGIASHEERPVAVGELPENNGVVALSLDVAVQRYFKKGLKKPPYIVVVLLNGPIYSNLFAVYYDLLDKLL